METSFILEKKNTDFQKKQFFNFIRFALNAISKLHIIKQIYFLLKKIYIYNYKKIQNYRKAECNIINTNYRIF